MSILSSLSFSFGMLHLMKIYYISIKKDISNCIPFLKFVFLLFGSSFFILLNRYVTYNMYCIILVFLIARSLHAIFGEVCSVLMTVVNLSEHGSFVSNM